jgi:hypothetical protein
MPSFALQTTNQILDDMSETTNGDGKRRQLATPQPNPQQQPKGRQLPGA